MLPNGISLTTPFHKAFLVKYDTFSARVEFLFDKVNSSLCLERANFWENKETVHLNITLADDPDVSVKAKIMLYKEAACLALKWSKLFPIKKQKDNTYESMEWRASLSFQANSSEEAFIYWVLMVLCPSSYASVYCELMDKHMKLSPEADAFAFKHLPDIQKIQSKRLSNKPCTLQELKLVSHFAKTFKMNEILKVEAAIHPEVKKGFNGLRYPQKLEVPGQSMDLKERITALSNADMTRRVDFYSKVLESRSPTKINEVD